MEHPFGALKRNAGLDKFLMRGLARRRGEFSLMTLGYNLKRVVNGLGFSALVAHFRQRPRIGAVGACLANVLPFSIRAAQQFQAWRSRIALCQCVGTLFEFGGGGFKNHPGNDSTSRKQ